jgi:sigma-B regulation protein RsbU (phosphoserine phosphatase)
MSLSGADSHVASADLFEAAPCGYVVLERSGTVLRANAEFLRLVGAPADEIIGVRTLSSLVSSGGRILLETHVRPILAHVGEVREIALELVQPDGGRVPVLLNARMLDPETRTSLVVVIETRDRRRYEDYLLGAARAAERASDQAASHAATLQRTLIPPEPPAVPHLEISAAYRPAGTGREVGGDFYDVFQVGPDAWYVVLGDVSGKGIQAAVVTSFVRHTVRSIAIAHPDPADLLRALDLAMRDHGTEHYCTVVAVRLDRLDTRWSLALALAGHPPALVSRPDGHTYELGMPGTPAGLMSDPHFHTVRHELGDETITLYTDGVTEARSSVGELFGEDRLTSLVRGVPHEPHVIVEQVVRAALEWQSDVASDDIAVVSFAAS